MVVGRLKHTTGVLSKKLCWNQITVLCGRFKLYCTSLSLTSAVEARRAYWFHPTQRLLHLLIRHSARSIDLVGQPRSTSSSVLVRVRGGQRVGFTNFTIAHVNVICPRHFASVRETAGNPSLISGAILIGFDPVDGPDSEADTISQLDSSRIR